MSEMVERVAQIIASSQDGLRDEYLAREIARAVIGAMREPTDAMLCAASDLDSDVATADDRIEVPAKPEITWPVMIDAALKD